MPTPIDIRPRAYVGQVGVGLVVVVVFVGIAVGGSVLSLVFAVGAATGLTIWALQMRVQVRGDHLFVRNLNASATLHRAEITDFSVADLGGVWKIAGPRRVVDLNLSDGRRLRLTATVRPDRDPNKADDFAAELNAWLHAEAGA